MLVTAGMFGLVAMKDKLVPGVVEYVKEVEYIETTPEWAKDEDAVKAAQDVIRKKELQAELEQLSEEVAERESRIIEIEKELGTY